MSLASEMTASQKDEMMCTYASLILLSEELEVSEDNLMKLVKAAGSKNSQFPRLFAEMFTGKNVKELLKTMGTVGGGGGGGASGAPAAAAKGGAEAAATKKEEPEEEDDADMGFSLFD